MRILEANTSIRSVPTPPAKPAARAHRRHRRARDWLLILPAALIMAAVFGVSIVYTARTSLYNYVLQYNTHEFIGLGNYLAAAKDSQLYGALLVTAEIGVPALIFETVLGVCFALLIKTVTRGSRIVFTLVASPLVMAPAIVGLIYRLLFASDNGPVNTLLGYIIGRPVDIQWLADRHLAPFSLAIADIWEMTPMVMLIVLAGLGTIPDEVYEAASTDGASRWRIFLHITLPLLRPYLALSIMLRAIDLFKLFDLSLVMTNGGPANATTTVTYYLYQTGIQNLNVGYGSALSIIVLAIAFVAVGGLTRAARRSTAS